MQPWSVNHEYRYSSITIHCYCYCWCWCRHDAEQCLASTDYDAWQEADYKNYLKKR